MIDTIFTSYFNVVSADYFKVITACICVVLVLDVVYNTIRGE